MMKKRPKITASKITKNIRSKTNNVKAKVAKKAHEGASKIKISKKKRAILNIILICVIAFVAL